MFCNSDICNWLLQSKSPIDAKVAKVVPTPNNGSSELVTLHQVKNEKEKCVNVWFMFQKTKYVWDSDKKRFRSVEFPVDCSFGKYMEWKGFQDENEVEAAEMEYGKNQ